MDTIYTDAGPVRVMGWGADTLAFEIGGVRHYLGPGDAESIASSLVRYARPMLARIQEQYRREDALSATDRETLAAIAADEGGK